MFKEDVEILKIVIKDEHHYRQMVQTRITYQSSLILALIALSGALIIRLDGVIGSIILLLVGILIYKLSNRSCLAWRIGKQLI